MNRTETLHGLRQSPKVDVCVLGGGINGLSVFRELALQGVNVLLVEQGDYCSGASAALSRMELGVALRALLAAVASLAPTAQAPEPAHYPAIGFARLPLQLRWA